MNHQQTENANEKYVKDILKYRDWEALLSRMRRVPIDHGKYSQVIQVLGNSMERAAMLYFLCNRLDVFRALGELSPLQQRREAILLEFRLKMGWDPTK